MVRRRSHRRRSPTRTPSHGRSPAARFISAIDFPDCTAPTFTETMSRARSGLRDTTVPGSPGCRNLWTRPCRSSALVPITPGNSTLSITSAAVCSGSSPMTRHRSTVGFPASSVTRACSRQRGHMRLRPGSSRIRSMPLPGPTMPSPRDLSPCLAADNSASSGNPTSNSVSSRDIGRSPRTACWPRPSRWTSRGATLNRGGGSRLNSCISTDKPGRPITTSGTTPKPTPYLPATQAATATFWSRTPTHPGAR